MAHPHPAGRAEFSQFQGHALAYLEGHRGILDCRLAHVSRGDTDQHGAAFGELSLFHPGQVAGDVAHLDPVLDADDDHDPQLLQ